MLPTSATRPTADAVISEATATGPTDRLLLLPNKP